jgi:hypothetical protein
MSSMYDNDRRVRLQLGSLEPLLQAAADAKGHSIQVEIRERLAASLGVPAPSLEEFRFAKPDSKATADPRADRK